MKVSKETIGGKLCTGFDPERRLIDGIMFMPNGCWEWQRSLEDGYGRISVGNKLDRVHRLAYALWVQDIPKGLMVRHKCDNRKCCNPFHLELGTNRDNINDMLKRGRSLRGEEKPAAKMTEDQVREVRRRNKNGESGRSLAKKFGVHPSTIQGITSGRYWTHVQ